MAKATSFDDPGSTWIADIIASLSVVVAAGDIGSRGVRSASTAVPPESSVVEFTVKTLLNTAGVTLTFTCPRLRTTRSLRALTFNLIGNTATGASSRAISIGAISPGKPSATSGSGD